MIFLFAIWVPESHGAASGIPAMPLDGWKPSDPGIQWMARFDHEPKDSELMVSLMALDDESAFRHETIRKFFAGVPDRPWESRDSLLLYGRRLLAEKERLKQQILFIDIYHVWPAYDAGRKGFLLDLLKPGSCAYFDNFRGITSDRVFTFDLGRYIEVSGVPAGFLLAMERKAAGVLMGNRDAQGRVLVRLHFRYSGISMRACAAGEGLQAYNHLEMLRFDFYPTPARWGVKPGRSKLIASFP